MAMNADEKKIVRQYKEIEKSLNGLVRKAYKRGLLDRFLGRGIKVRFVPRLTFGASVPKNKKEILINVGTMPILEAIVINVSKMPFLSSGDYDQNVVQNIEYVVAAACHGIDSVEVDDERLEAIFEYPSDVMSGNYAYFMYKVLLFFVLYHEMAHVLCGHNGSSVLGCIDDGPSAESGIGNDIAYRSLARRHFAELEADAVASMFLFENLKVDCFLSEAPEDSVELNREKAVYTFFFAVGLLFLIFSNDSQDLDSYKMSNHPPPVVRFAHVFDCVKQYVLSTRAGDAALIDLIGTVAQQVIVDLHEIELYTSVSMIKMSLQNPQGVEDFFNDIILRIGEDYRGRQRVLIEDAVSFVKNSTSFL
jgi:hypothetical protein